MKNVTLLRAPRCARILVAGLLGSLLALTASAQVEAYYSINGQPFVRLADDSFNSVVDSYLVVADSPVTFALRSTTSSGRALLSPGGIQVNSANGFSVFTLQPGTNRHVSFGGKKAATIVVGKASSSAPAAQP